MRTLLLTLTLVGCSAPPTARQTTVPQRRTREDSTPTPKARLVWFCFEHGRLVGSCHRDEMECTGYRDDMLRKGLDLGQCLRHEGVAFCYLSNQAEGELMTCTRTVEQCQFRRDADVSSNSVIDATSCGPVDW